MGPRLSSRTSCQRLKNGRELEGLGLNKTQTDYVEFHGNTVICTRQRGRVRGKRGRVLQYFRFLLYLLDCRVLALTAVLLGPFPILVYARIWNSYVTKLSSPARAEENTRPLITSFSFSVF